LANDQTTLASIGRLAHMLQTFNSKKDPSSSYLHYEAATSSVENAGIAYQAPSLLAFGAGAKEIALLSTISNLFFALLLVRLPSFLKLGDSLKRATVVLGIISVLGWLPLILVPMLVKGFSPFLLIGLWVVNLVPNMMVAPLRDKWLSDIVPAGRLGRYLSIRSIVSASTYLSFFYVMGYLLDHFQPGFFSGFSVVFLISFAMSLVSLALYFIIKVPVPMGESDHSEMGLTSFIREARQNNLGVFLLFSAAVIFSASVCGAFFSVYMLRDLHFAYLTYTLVISAEFMARIGISFFGGRWVDNSGAIKVLRYASYLIPTIPVLWLFSHNLFYLLGIQIISGTAWATFDLCTQSYLCKSCSTAKRLHYIVYHRSIVTLAAALGPLLGSLLLNVMFPVFGNPILGMFLLSGILRVVAVVALLPRLKESDEDIPQAESAVPGLIDEYLQKPGLPEIQLYNSVKSDVRLPKLKRMKAAPKIKVGSFYHPEYWPGPVNTANKPEKVARLKDHISQNIEDPKKWTSRMTATHAFNI
jgi:MFS family permease